MPCGVWGPCMRVLGVPGGSGVAVWGHRGTCGVWVSCGGSQREYGVPVWGPGGVSGGSRVPVLCHQGSLGCLGSLYGVPVGSGNHVQGSCVGPLRGLGSLYGTTGGPCGV